ncbi:MAG: hypothetical protein Kow0042_24000 [Calditrichia bacterium]
MEIQIQKYNDVWLDNGLATFTGFLQEVIDEDNSVLDLKIADEAVCFKIQDQEAFVDTLSDIILSKLKQMIVLVEDKKTGERKEVKKDYILIQEGTKVEGRVVFKESVFQKEATRIVVQEIYNNLFGDKTVCFFCNRKFKKSIKKIQQASYPFVTKIQSLSGIRSGIENKLTEYISEYCPQCYLNGIVEWLDDSMVYRSLPGDKSIIILPNTEKLDDLIRLKENYKSLLNNEARWSNIRIDINKEDTENTPGRFTTFISFYENFLRYIEPKFDNENWYIIEVPLRGSVKNPKYFNILINDKIARLLKILIRQQYAYFYRIFIKQFYAFHTDPKKGNRDFDREKELHEQLCYSLLEDNFEKFAEAFIPRKGIRPGISKEAQEVLNKLIYYWRIDPMQIENKEDYLKTLGMAGSTLARLIGGRLGLFFKLEKATNPNQFFEAIQEISRRIMIDDIPKIGTIYPHALEKISQMILERYDHKDGKEFFATTKNILLIYTSLRTKRENQPSKEE